MEFTHIPNITIPVARIALGTWSIGGWMWGGTEEKTAISTIHKAWDTGINLIDTAPVYGFGKSEEIIAKALKQYGKREQIVIATKVGLNWKDHEPFRDSHKSRILKEIDDSLKRLGVTYIDLYQVHWPDPYTPIAETAGILHELLKVGKIRAIGVSNYSLDEIEIFKKTAPLHAVQPPFNIFENEAEKKLIPFCKQHNIVTLGYGSLCRGLLSGKMHPDSQFEGDDIRKFDPKFQAPHYRQYLACVDSLQNWVQKRYKRNIFDLAIRYALDKGIDIALLGARRPEHLSQIGSIWNWKLTLQDFEEIDEILDKIPNPIGPEFMAPPAAFLKK